MKYKQQQPWQKLDKGADSLSWRTSHVGKSCEKVIKHPLLRSLLATICSLGLLTANC